MSTNDYTNLFTLYESLADDLIEKINNTSVSLHYIKTRLQTITNTVANAPTNFQRLGGRVHVDNMAGRSQESGSNLKEETYPDNIKARVYWEPKDNQAIRDELKVDSKAHICKLITYNSYLNKLLSSDFAEIDGFKCKMIRRPTPYGLGGNKRYCLSYWQVFDDNQE